MKQHFADTIRELSQTEEKCRLRIAALQSDLERTTALRLQLETYAKTGLLTPAATAANAAAKIVNPIKRLYTRRSLKMATKMPLADTPAQEAKSIPVTVLPAPSVSARKPLDSAKDSVDAMLNTGNAPTTLAAAIKEFLRNASAPVTIEQMHDYAKSKYRDLYAARDVGTIAANVTYWVAQAKLEKLGLGNLATFRVRDQVFFQPKESE